MELRDASHWAYGTRMLGRLYEKQDCSAARALELVGERWSLLILRDALFRNFTRFSQFQKSLGLATNILAKRLEGFVAVGLMEHRQPQASGEQAEYQLTQKGLELKPVIIALTEWGDKWVQPGPVVFQHKSDGQPVELQLRGVGDDTQVAIADVVVRQRYAVPPRDTDEQTLPNRSRNSH
ncbi:MAG: winged helix-turn-helix transcriptional regulator [Dehalococcoidia bacterium]